MRRLNSKCRCLKLLFSLCLPGVPLAAVAENEALECLLMVHEVNSAPVKKLVTGQTLRLNKLYGVADCDDGRLLQAQIVQTEVVSDGFTLLTGYGVYAFESGDTITVSIRGEQGRNSTSIDYRIIAGSGKYRKANGAGAVSHVPNPWQDTELYDLTLIVEMQQ